MDLFSSLFQPWYLPPAYVRTTGGYVFTGVCLFRGEGGIPGLRFSGGGGEERYPVSVEGNFFDTRFGFIHVQTGKTFLLRDHPPPPPVKGKIFDTRFGLIHVQTGKKFFVEGPPPPVKGKFFDTRFGLIHVQTGKKFMSRDPPPSSKGKNFWHQIWLDTCSD